MTFASVLGVSALYFKTFASATDTDLTKTIKPGQYTIIDFIYMPNGNNSVSFRLYNRTATTGSYAQYGGTVIRCIDDKDYVIGNVFAISDNNIAITVGSYSTMLIKVIEGSYSE